jgi:nitroreductase
MVETNCSSQISLCEAIHTARALRRFKPDPGPEALLEQILDAAIRAPSAGNAQNWAFILVRDAQLRGALGAIYRKASRIADAMYAARGRPAHLSERQFQSMLSTGSHLWEHMGDARPWAWNHDHDEPHPLRRGSA